MDLDLLVCLLSEKKKNSGKCSAVLSMKLLIYFLFSLLISCNHRNP